MTLSAINWLTISIDLLLVVFVIVCVLMSMIILMQRPKNEGLGAAFGSGATDQLFGARTTNVLQKSTVYLASLFFVLTLVLAILIQKDNANTPTLINREAVVAPPVVEEQPSSIAEEAEKAGEKPLEPEVVTPPAEAPPMPEETPAPDAPKPDEAPPVEGSDSAPQPDADPATPPTEAPPSAEGEPKPADEAPPAEEP